MCIDYSDLKKYKFKDNIGEGNFGKVKLATFLPTNEDLAVKILNKKIIELKMKNTIFRELDIINKFNHINIVYVHEIIEDADNYYIIMEYCKNGELFDYIVKKHRLKEAETAILFYQLINGVSYIHSKGIAHRDLKPENLLLDKDNTLKIIDFGLSHEFDGYHFLKTKCGSPSYASPEIILGQFYDGFQIDSWCCGIILYGMLCGFLPFEGDDNKILFENILECNPELPEFLSECTKELLILILNPNPSERITIAQIKEHEFYYKGKYLCETPFYKRLKDNIKNRKLYKRRSNNSTEDCRALKLKKNRGFGFNKNLQIEIPENTVNIINNFNHIHNNEEAIYNNGNNKVNHNNSVDNDSKKCNVYKGNNSQTIKKINNVNEYYENLNSNRDSNNMNNNKKINNCNSINNNINNINNNINNNIIINDSNFSHKNSSRKIHYKGDSNIDSNNIEITIDSGVMLSNIKNPYETSAIKTNNTNNLNNENITKTRKIMNNYKKKMHELNNKLTLNLNNLLTNDSTKTKKLLKIININTNSSNNKPIKTNYLLNLRNINEKFSTLNAIKNKKIKFLNIDKYINNLNLNSLNNYRPSTTKNTNKNQKIKRIKHSSNSNISNINNNAIKLNNFNIKHKSNNKNYNNIYIIKNHFEPLSTKNKHTVSIDNPRTRNSKKFIIGKRNNHDSINLNINKNGHYTNGSQISQYVHGTVIKNRLSYKTIGKIAKKGYKISLTNLLNYKSKIRDKDIHLTNLKYTLPVGSSNSREIKDKNIYNKNHQTIKLTKNLNYLSSNNTINKNNVNNSTIAYQMIPLYNNLGYNNNTINKDIMNNTISNRGSTITNSNIHYNSITININSLNLKSNKSRRNYQHLSDKNKNGTLSHKLFGSLNFLNSNGNRNCNNTNRKKKKLSPNNITKINRNINNGINVNNLNNPNTSNIYNKINTNGYTTLYETNNTKHNNFKSIITNTNNNNYINISSNNNYVYKDYSICSDEALSRQKIHRKIKKIFTEPNNKKLHNKIIRREYNANLRIKSREKSNIKKILNIDSNESIKSKSRKKDSLYENRPCSIRSVKNIFTNLSKKNKNLICKTSTNGVRKINSKTTLVSKLDSFVKSPRMLSPKVSVLNMRNKNIISLFTGK